MTETTTHKSPSQIAKQIRDAESSGITIAPVREYLGETDIELAYQVQKINTDHHVENGRVICGRKIGLTSPAVQQQLGVDQPDFGILYQDMEFRDGDTVPWSRLMQPKIEAEIAIVLKNDLHLHSQTIDEAGLLDAVDYALPALEIVGSRIAQWKINICDTIADNASSGVYVLGKTPADKAKIDWRTCGMVIKHNGEPVSTGCGAACLGNPLSAAVWLADTMARYKMPLVAGDVVLTGALGPMVPVNPGDHFVASINGVGTLTVLIGPE